MSNDSCFRKASSFAAATLLFALSGTASAAPITIDYEEFVIFSGATSGTTSIAGASLVYGNVGSNTNFSITGDTQILGDVYVGGNFSTGSNVAIGAGVTADGDPPPPVSEIASIPNASDPSDPFLYGEVPVYEPLQTQVVVNGDATLSGTNSAQPPSRIYGDLSADDVTLNGGSTIRDDDPTGAGGSGGSVEYTSSCNPNGTDCNDTTRVEGGATMKLFDARTTFELITMTSGVTFEATGADQMVDGSDFLELASGGGESAYGALSTSDTGQTVRLSSGDYYFSSVSTQAQFTLEVDLSSGEPININVVGDANFGGKDTVLKVCTANCDNAGNYVSIDQAQHLAGLINWTVGGTFTLGGGDNSPSSNTNWTTIFGGLVYSALESGDGVVTNQYIDWYGALWAYDEVNVADHSKFTYVAQGSAQVPEPTTLLLFAAGLLGLAGIRSKRGAQ